MSQTENGSVSDWGNLPASQVLYPYFKLLKINCKKVPNIFGRDRFNMVIIKQTGYLTYWHGKFSKPGFYFYSNGRDRETLKQECTQHKGFGCGQLIMIDGWQIKDDYPW